MRQDMAKVIVEKARGGRGRATRKRERKMREMSRDREHDTQATVQSMRDSRRRPDYKWPSDNLNPLWRFLDKNVGRPWAKVYSEICAACDRKSVVQAHVLEHVKDKVVMNPVFVEGRVYYIYDGVIGGLKELNSFQLYVDRHGILRRVKKKGK